MDIKEKARHISEFVDAHQEQYFKMSDDIWEAPETGFQEVKSSAILTGALKEAGFAVERGCGRLEWSCLDWNRPSIDFYLSMGAEPMNGWTVYRLSGKTLTDMAEK